MNTQRDAYLSFATGYLWGALNDIRLSGQIDDSTRERLNDIRQFIAPIIAKLYEPETIDSDRFLLFNTGELKGLLNSLFSNDQVWRPIVQAELDRRQGKI